MAKMDKYEEMFEGLDLSDEFKRSFLMAKGIDVSEPEEVVATQEPSASLVNTPVQEKQQESVDETKTTTPIPTKVQPQTSESKVFYKDVTEKIEASLADEYENIVKEKNHLLSTYDPDLSISLKEDVNQFFNPTMAEPQKKSVENKPIKIKAQSMHKEMLGVENNKAIENVVEESTEIKPVEIEAEDNKVVENVIEENIETKDERVKVLKEFEQEKIEDQDLLLDDDLLDEEEDDDFLDDDFDEKPKKKFFDKFSKKKESDDNDDFDDVEEKAVKTAPKQASAPKQTASAPSKVTVKQERAERQTRPAASSKITPMRSSRKSNQGPNMEVCVIKPSSMEDTREIADTLVDNSTVILNLEGIDVELAQRIIDFTSGACYSLGGSLQKVSSYIFVLGPYNVDITGDLQNILGGSAPSVRAGY